MKISFELPLKLMFLIDAEKSKFPAIYLFPSESIFTPRIES